VGKEQGLGGSGGKAVSPGSIIVASKEQVSCDLDGEAAILNLKDGVYYGLDSVGATVWQCVQQPRRFAEIRDAILDEYEIDSQQCERDLGAVLSDLAACGLVDVTDAETA
jgi:coenzyme PQQ synthesis protein D (PqqD)